MDNDHLPEMRMFIYAFPMQGEKRENADVNPKDRVHGTTRTRSSENIINKR